MPTTADYLSALKAKQAELAAGLRGRGVPAEDNELLDTLVPKVSTVTMVDGLAKGTSLALASRDVFTVREIPHFPHRICISAQEAMSADTSTTSDYVLINLLTVDNITADVTEYEIEVNTLTAKAAVKVYVTVTQEDEGYTVSVSLAEANAALTAPYIFYGNTAYNWIITTEGWGAE